MALHLLAPGSTPCVHAAATCGAMLRTPRRDLVAGVTVGVVALPLALAFGIASGLGATAGLVTAVVAGAVAALFGAATCRCPGRPAPWPSVLVPIVATHGADGCSSWGCSPGCLLVAMGLAGAGRYVRLIPLPVIEGFTLGIAALIALQQVPAALGATAAHEHVVVSAAAPCSWLVAPAARAARRQRRGGRCDPPALPAAPGGAGGPARRRGGHGRGAAGRPARGDDRCASVAPVHASACPRSTWSDLRVLVVPAVAVAALAALESLLSATVADAMSVSTRHDPDRELFGQGLANLASPLLGGIPATAAIARTAVNVRSGARSRLAARRPLAWCCSSSCSPWPTSSRGSRWPPSPACSSRRPCAWSRCRACGRSCGRRAATRSCSP